MIRLIEKSVNMSPGSPQSPERAYPYEMYLKSQMLTPILFTGDF